MANDGSKIVRAGIYSKTGANNILVTCNDHAPIPLGNIGTAALVAANNVVAHGANACVFTVAPASLPVFSKAFDSAQQLPYPRVAGAFHHSKEPVALAQFGNHETGAQVVDREGSGTAPTGASRPTTSRSTRALRSTRWPAASCFPTARVIATCRSTTRASAATTRASST